MVPLDEKRTLETGRMVNPETGIETDYEEIWEDEAPGIIGGTEGNSVQCVVLKYEQGREKGLAIIMGGLSQGILKTKKGVSCQRGEFHDGLGWETSVEMGEEGIPWKDVAEDMAGFKVGSEVCEGGRVWKIIEMAG